ncbi:uncharacterized protein TEOVI_000059000 [Trypanosoma equiperdum]|uniref:Mitochondrial RNA binding complex 1 subunit n=1 Tax=Trypanosoma equiperdum TaxID=5694 RepID=A0A1G4IA65_TRYEQ|nr:hypothetical protein, conserved [Trypanosoma equiperdum]
MFQLTLRHHSKRTPGYVFWRQSTLVELEHARRNYLLSERPLPIADVARRMVRVKSRYLDTKDFNEKSLLRGEYKYFSGKSCDIRHARPEDLVAYVECGSFFGFWDAAQMNRILQELLLKLDELGAAELFHLFTSLPSLRKQTGELHFCVARRLVDEISNLTVDECIHVCAACDQATPRELVRGLVQMIGPMVSNRALSAAQCVEIMDTLGACCLPGENREFDLFFKDTKEVVVLGMTTLGVMDIAVACTSMRLLGILDAITEKEAVRLFTSRLNETCASSMAMMFSAVGSDFIFCQAVGERVVYLATDFTPSEMLSIFAVYLTNIVSLCPASSGGVAIGDSACEMPQEEWTAGRGVGERHFAHQRRNDLLNVIRELMDQTLSLLESASAYVSPVSQLQFVAVFHRAVENLCGDVEQLLNFLPSLNRCMHLLSAKLIASLTQYTYSELIVLLQMCNPLGRLLTNAAVGAVVHELLRREVGASGGEAMSIYATLRQLTGLRAEYRVRIERDLLPRLLARCSHT